MNAAAEKTIYQRRFLLEALPTTLTRSDAHLQVLDSYLPGTRFRIRTVRNPANRQTNVLLEQLIPIESADLSRFTLITTELNEPEISKFGGLTNVENEVRFNRYKLRYGDNVILIDAFLGSLLGLVIASVNFTDVSEMHAFRLSDLDAVDVTQNAVFFAGGLAGKSTADVREALN